MYGIGDCSYSQIKTVKLKETVYFIYFQLLNDKIEYDFNSH